MIFDEILNTFENEDIKHFATKCIDAAPKYFWEVPASSSLKYHPSFACETPLGLAKHTVALCRILNYMFEVESIRNQYTSRERDLLRVAGIAHDMMKSGNQEDYEISKYTKFDHPILAAKMIQNIDGLNKDEKKFIGEAISSHMGQWNTNQRSSVVLPKPENKYQIILHLADYIASRKNIDMKFDTVGEQIKQEAPDINTWRFTFGKKKGQTIPEVAAKDPGYIIWAKSEMKMEPARTLLKDFEI